MRFRVNTGKPIRFTQSELEGPRKKFKVEEAPKQSASTSTLLGDDPFEDDDEDEPVAKKRKTSTALVPVATDRERTAAEKKRALTKTDRKRHAAIEASFGAQAPKIIELLEMEDSDGAITLLKKRLLQTTVDLIPLTEESVRNSDGAKGIYQFSTLVSQARELIVDIQADYDKQHLAKVLEDKVIRPAFMEMAQELITDHHDFKSRVVDCVRPQHTLEFSTELKDLATKLARKMTDKFFKVRQGIEASLKG